MIYREMPHGGTKSLEEQEGMVLFVNNGGWINDNEEMTQTE